MTIATRAATARPSAEASRLATTGRSTRIGPALKWRTSWKIVRIANQTARFRMTPTTAAVMAQRTPARPVAAQPLDIGGADKDPRKRGVKVTQVARRPPSVPARSGDIAPASR
jgi:hypothetical protein